MLPTPSTAHPRPDPASGLLRAVAAVLAVLALVLGQAAPAAAGQGESALVWIEICGEDGAGHALVGSHESPETCICTDCDCLLSGPGPALDPSPVSYQYGTSYGAGAASPGARSQIVPDAAEQYWAATRGPPRQKANTQMTSFVGSTGFTPDNAGSGMGGSPCA